MSELVVGGVLLGAISSVCSSYANVLMKVSHGRVRSIHHETIMTNNFPILTFLGSQGFNPTFFYQFV